MTKEFAQLLGGYMERQGFSQRELGEESEVNHSTISRALGAERNLTWDVASDLADALLIKGRERVKFYLYAAGHPGHEVDVLLGRLEDSARNRK